MKVHKSDGVCRECGGQLQVVDADDSTMTVLCEDCGDEYLVEPDAFGDGGTMYYVGFLAEQAEGVPDEPEDIEGDSAIDEE